MKYAMFGRIAVTTLLMATPLGVASAADMPLKAPPAPLAPAFSWTGFEIGVDAGVRLSSPHWDTTCVLAGALGTTCPNSLTSSFNNNNPTDFDSTSARLGGHVGYNWQINPTIVIGLEGDAAWANNSNTIGGIPGAEIGVLGSSPGLDSATVRQTWDASARGRLGVLVTPTMLLYGTAGAAFTHETASATCGSAFPVGWCILPANIGTTSTISANRTGWTAGAGFESVMTGHWLVRAEWRYSDYGKMSGMFFSSPASIAAGDGINASVHLRTEMFSAGVGYKF